LSFSRIAYRTFNEAGGITYPISLGRQMHDSLQDFGQNER